MLKSSNSPQIAINETFVINVETTPNVIPYTIDYKRTNDPINLDFVVSISKYTTNLIPIDDLNTETICPIFKIKFIGEKRRTLSCWEYTSEELRDKDFDNLIG